MAFEVGSSVVHPAHGTATVRGHETRTIGGVEREYVVLEREEDHLQVLVPREDLDEHGIRAVMGSGTLDEVMDTLADEPDRLGGDWRARVRRNEQRIRSGDPVQVATALRELRALEDDDRITETERGLLRDATTRLLDEIDEATGSDVDATGLVEDALADE